MPVPTDVHERIREMEAVENVPGWRDMAPERVERRPRKWADPVRAGVSYFRVPDKRMPRGRITLLQNGQNATECVMYRDYQLLRQYGGYHGANHPGDWQRNDVYLGILHDGGIREFDAPQIVENCWHLRPGPNANASHRVLWVEIDRLIDQGLSEDDAVLRVIPQVAGVDRTPPSCEACPDRPFPTAEAVKQHRSVMHKDDVQTMGTRDAIAQALQAGSGSSALDKLADAMTAMVEQNRLLMEQMAAQSTPRRGRPPKTSDDDE